jgi:HSP20 family molecular chaperone IbpA
VVVEMPGIDKKDIKISAYDTCNLKLSKEILRCPDCKQKVRVKPWHCSKIIEHKRL